MRQRHKFRQVFVKGLWRGKYRCGQCGVVRYRHRHLHVYYADDQYDWKYLADDHTQFGWSKTHCPLRKIDVGHSLAKYKIPEAKP